MRHMMSDRSTRESWHRRYAALADPPRENGLAAGIAVAVVVAQLVLVPVTLALAAGLFLAGRLARWRPGWLAWPVAAGVGWTLTVGTSPALAGYLAWAAHVITVLSGAGPSHAGIAIPGLVARSPRYLAGQAPLALVVAAAEALVADRVREPFRKVPPVRAPPGRGGHQ